MSHHTTIVSGRISNDPELKYLQGSGAAVCNFTIPVTERWKDRSDQWQERTTWYEVAVWGKRGEWCAEWLRKGSVVTVSGNVDARGWVNKKGDVSTAITLRARDVTPLSDWGKGENQQARTSGGHQSNSARTQSSPAQKEPEDIDSIPF